MCGNFSINSFLKMLFNVEVEFIANLIFLYFSSTVILIETKMNCKFRNIFYFNTFLEENIDKFIFLYYNDRA